MTQRTRTVQIANGAAESRMKHDSNILRNGTDAMFNPCSARITTLILNGLRMSKDCPAPAEQSRHQLCHD